MVDVRLAAGGDRLCLLAHGGGDLVFRRAYPDNNDRGEGPQSGTLTFVAGDRVHADLRVSARLMLGGAPTAHGSLNHPFGPVDDPSVVLDVRACHPRPQLIVEPVLRPLAELPNQGAEARLLAVDIDGDGRQELVATHFDGRPLALYPTHSPTDLVDLELRGDLPAATIAALAADLDGDCLMDAIFLAEGGAIPVRGLGHRSEVGPPMGGTPWTVAVGDFMDGDPTVVIGGPGGLTMVHGTDGRTMTLGLPAFGSTVAADLTGDGHADLVASGPTGTTAWIGSDAGPIAGDAALPASVADSTGPLAIGDLGADPAIDLVAANGNQIFVAMNRGDGFLEERPAIPPLTLPADITDLAIADLNGDCVGEIIALDADGFLVVFQSQGPSNWTTPLGLENIRHVTPVDLDGDGALELAILTELGQVRIWGP